MKMDVCFAYHFSGLNEGPMKKMLATGKEIYMKKGQRIFKRKWLPSS
jgi:hypothetical protein